MWSSPTHQHQSTHPPYPLSLQPIRKVPKHALSGCISLSDDFPDSLLALAPFVQEGQLIVARRRDGQALKGRSPWGARSAAKRAGQGEGGVVDDNLIDHRSSAAQAVERQEAIGAAAHSDVHPYKSLGDDRPHAPSLPVETRLSPTSESNQHCRLDTSPRYDAEIAS